MKQKNRKFLLIAISFILACFCLGCGDNSLENGTYKGSLQLLKKTVEITLTLKNGKFSLQTLEYIDQNVYEGTKNTYSGKYTLSDDKISFAANEKEFLFSTDADYIPTKSSARVKVSYMGYNVTLKKT